MLQTMRHLAQSWLFKGLMMILVVSFGIWGVGDIFRGNPLQHTVATVGSESITVQDLQRAFQSALVQMRRSFGPELTERQAKQLGLLDQVLEQLIARDQVDLETTRLGIDFTEKATIQWFAAQPELHNPDGSFNRELFRRAAEKEHLDESDFIARWRENIQQRELFYPFGNSGKIPDTIIDAVAKARAQKRILDVLTLANDSMRDIPVPDDKALHDFYDKNPQSFTAPEYRAVTVASLSTGDITKDIAISDDEVKKEYDAHIAQYAYPERRDIVQVVAMDEAKAKQLVIAARASGNLTDAAAAAGLKAVPINQMEEKTLLPELAPSIFALKPGEISDPVKSPLGWHVIQLKKITPPGTSGFDTIKDGLRETMRQDKAADTATRLANQLDDELAAGHALEDIADSLKLRLVKIPALDANGKTPDGKVPPELPGKNDALKAAFGQNAGEVSPIIDDKNGNYIVVRTDQVTPSAARPLDTVKDQVAAAWKAQEQATRATAEAEKIAKALRTGQAASSFAAQDGVEIRVSKPISLLGDADAALPSSVLPQVMKMKKGDVVTAPVPGHQIILRLATFVDPDAAAEKTAAAKVGADIGEQMGDELVQQYKMHLQETFPPKVDQDVLESVRQQGG